MNMKELKLETLLGSEIPKSTSLSQVGKAERAIKLLRKDAIKNPRNRLSNPGSGNSGLREWIRVDYNASRFKGTDIDGPAWKTVVSRITYDLTDGNNQIIEHISVDRVVGAATLYRKLPPNVSQINNSAVQGGIREQEC